MKHLRAGAELAGLALRQSTQISQLQTERRGCAAVLRTASTKSACEPSASGRTPFALRQAVAAASGARQDGHEGQQDGRTLQAAPRMTGLAAAMLFTQTVAQCDAVRCPSLRTAKLRMCSTSPTAHRHESAKQRQSFLSACRTEAALTPWWSAFGKMS